MKLFRNLCLFLWSVHYKSQAKYLANIYHDEEDFVAGHKWIFDPEHNLRNRFEAELRCARRLRKLIKK